MIMNTAKLDKESVEQTKARVLALIESEFESDASFERDLGLASKTVNNWRRGKSASFMKMLPKIAEALDVSVGELMNIPIRGESSELSDDEISLLTLYRKACILPAKKRSALAKTLETVINLYMSSH